MLRKTLTALIGVVVLALTLAAIPAAGTPPGCTPDPGQPYVAPTYETIVIEEAWTEVVVIEAGYWQRYSYNGPWPSNTEAPPFPDAKWQPNVKGDPHGIGVAGPYFRSHGNSGNGDWFYLEAVPAVTETIEHPAVTEERLVDPGQPYVAPTTCPGVPSVPPAAPQKPPAAPEAAPAILAPSFTG